MRPIGLQRHLAVVVVAQGILHRLDRLEQVARPAPAEQRLRELGQVAKSLEPLAQPVLPHGIEPAEVGAVAHHLAPQAPQRAPHVLARRTAALVERHLLAQQREQRILERRCAHHVAGVRHRHRRRHDAQRGPAGGLDPRLDGAHHMELVAVLAQRTERVDQRRLAARVQGRQRLQFAQRRAQTPDAHPQLVHVVLVVAAGGDRAGIADGLPEAGREHGADHLAGAGLARVVDGVAAHGIARQLPVLQQPRRVRPC